MIDPVIKAELLRSQAQFFKRQGNQHAAEASRQAVRRIERLPANLGPLEQKYGKPARQPIWRAK